jgi:hypothetical protein
MRTVPRNPTSQNRGVGHPTMQHPLIQSAEKGEDWEWCYIDEAYI